MSFEPFNWNVMVIGAWNRAILTPEWIGRNIFRLEPGTPVAIEVPLNMSEPWRVRHDAMIVQATPRNLEVIADACAFEILDRARQCALHALDELPVTPLAAAGFNIRYRSSTAPPELAAVLSCELDNFITNRGLIIGRRRQHRALSYDAGTLNLEVTVDPDEGATIQFNFHRGSADSEALKTWLSLPIADVRSKVEAVMDSLPGVIYERDK